MAAVHAISKGWLRMRLTETAGQAVAVYPAFRRVLHLSASAAQFLSQAVYWTEKTDDGWFYKTEQEWDEEIALSAKEVRSARKKLELLGLLEQVRRGVPAKMHFRVNTDLLLDYLEGKKDIPEPAQTAQLVLPKGNNKTCPNGTTGSSQTAQLVLPVGPNKSAPNGRTITEITQETTQEITSEITSAVVAKATKPRAKKSSDDEAEAERQSTCRDIWKSYSQAYEKRYGVTPVRNAMVNRQVVDLWKRLGVEAVGVAAYFVSINDSFLIRNVHDMGSLLAKAEAYRTQWATNRQITATRAQQMDQTQANRSTVDEALEILRQQGRIE